MNTNVRLIGWSCLLFCVTACVKQVEPAVTLTVSITSPADNSVEIESFDVSVNVEPADVATRVELYLNNAIIGTANKAPYQFTIDITGYTPRDYTLKAIAYGASGKSFFAETQVSIAKPTLDAPLNVKASKGDF